MKEVILALITFAGIALTAYLSYRGLVVSKRAEKTVQYELRENGGNSAIDKIKVHIQEELGELRDSLDKRLNTIDSRFENLDRKDNRRAERMEAMDRRISFRDKTILRIVDEIQEIRRIVDKIKES